MAAVQWPEASADVSPSTPQSVAANPSIHDIDGSNQPSTSTLAKEGPYVSSVPPLYAGNPSTLARKHLDRANLSGAFAFTTGDDDEHDSSYNTTPVEQTAANDGTSPFFRAWEASPHHQMNMDKHPYKADTSGQIPLFPTHDARPRYPEVPFPAGKFGSILPCATLLIATLPSTGHAEVKDGLAGRLPSTVADRSETLFAPALHIQTSVHASFPRSDVSSNTTPTTPSGAIPFAAHQHTSLASRILLRAPLSATATAPGTPLLSTASTPAQSPYGDNVRSLFSPAIGPQPMTNENPSQQQPLNTGIPFPSAESPVFGIQPLPMTTSISGRSMRRDMDSSGLDSPAFGIAPTPAPSSRSTKSSTATIHGSNRAFDGVAAVASDLFTTSMDSPAFGVPPLREQTLQQLSNRRHVSQPPTQAHNASEALSNRHIRDSTVRASRIQAYNQEESYFPQVLHAADPTHTSQAGVPFPVAETFDNSPMSLLSSSAPTRSILTMMAPSRSESENSISSIVNDDGHDEIALHRQSQAAAAVPADDIHPVPYRIAPSGAGAKSGAYNKGSDPPPLIPFPRPKKLSLAQDAQIRPISPFSPSTAIIPSLSQYHHIPTALPTSIPSTSAASVNLMQGHQRLRTLSLERDLINFDSDNESAGRGHATSRLVRDTYSGRPSYNRFDSYVSSSGVSAVDYDSASETDVRPSDSAGPSTGRFMATEQNMYEQYADAEEDDHANQEDEDEEEEDLDRHPLYAVLSKSASPYLRRAWETSTIVLIPPRQTLPADFMKNVNQNDDLAVLFPPDDEDLPSRTPLEWECWAALHALAPHLSSTPTTSEAVETLLGHGKSKEGEQLLVRLNKANGQIDVRLQIPHSPIVSATGQSHQVAALPVVNDAADSLSIIGMTSASTFDDDLRRSTSTTSGSSHATSMSAVPPHLFISSSPTSSMDSSVYPLTPPFSPPLRSNAIRSVSGSLHGSLRSGIAPAEGSPLVMSGSSVDLQKNAAFASGETILPGSKTPVTAAFQAFDAKQSPLAPTRRLRIVSESPIYRRRRASSAAMSISASAPVTLPPVSEASRAQLPMHQIAGRASISSLSSILLNKPQPPLPVRTVSSIAPLQTVRKRDSKVRLKVPKWLRSSASRDSLNASTSSASPTVDKSPLYTGTESAPATPHGTTRPGVLLSAAQDNRLSTISISSSTTSALAVQESSRPVIDKVRIVRVDNYVVEWPGQQYVFPTIEPSRRLSRQPHTAKSHMKEGKAIDLSHSTASQTTSSQTHASSTLPTRNNSNASSKISNRHSGTFLYKHANASASSGIGGGAGEVATSTRDFASDIAYMLEPPRQIASMSGALQDALRQIIGRTRDLCDDPHFGEGSEPYMSQVGDCQDDSRRSADAIYEQRLLDEVLDPIRAVLFQQAVSRSQRQRLCEVLEK